MTTENLKLIILL